MRTARPVIVCLLALCAAGVLWAQQPKPAEGSVDSSVTVMGRDDSVIPVPAPGNLEEEIHLPPLDGLLDDALGESTGWPLVPPVSPPVADILLPPRGIVLMPALPRPTLE
jgi:hypothetical protein